jgi:hypothetical protein
MNGLKNRAMSSFARLRQPNMWGTAALALTLTIPAAAFATTRVSGTAESVSVNADNSTIKDVLSALSKQFKLQFESSANLDKQITGTYQGSLPRVVARLLEGYNFFIKANQGVLAITVFGTRNGSTVAGTPPTIARVTVTPVSPQATPTVAQVQRPQEAQQPQISPPPKTAAGTALSPVAGKAPAASIPVPAPQPNLVKVAEGPMPVPGASTAAGPVPKPATASMPTPTTSGTMPSIAPTPSTATDSAALPMPTTSTPFPGVKAAAPATAPGSSPAPSAPTPQK